MAKSDGHISQQDLAILRENPYGKETSSTRKHLRSCPTCAEILQLLDAAAELADGAPPEGRAPVPSADEISEYLMQIYTGSLDKQEAASYYHQLLHIDDCFRRTFDLMNESLMPVSEKERERLSVYSGLSIAEEVTREMPPLSSQKLLTRVRRLAKRAGDWFYRIPDLFYGLFKISNPGTLMRAAFYTMFVLLIGGGARFGLYWQEQRFWTQYEYDDKTPFDYDPLRLPAAFRGGGIENEPGADKAQADLFIRHFKHVVREYGMRRYRRSLEQISGLRTLAEGLMAGAKGRPEHASLLRDYYLIAGAANLGLARSKQEIENAATSRIEHQAAIENLQHSLRIALEHKLPNRDTDMFLLALSYGFAGRESEALATLDDIQLESRFFKESLELKARWSK